jgi:hypothetical protein
MPTLTIECRSFVATPIGENRVRLDIAEPEKNESASFGSGEAAALLSRVFGHPVHRNTLSYWRRRGLPHTKIGPKKIIYREDDVVRWTKSIGLSIL